MAKIKAPMVEPDTSINVELFTCLVITSVMCLVVSLIGWIDAVGLLSRIIKVNIPVK